MTRPTQQISRASRTRWTIWLLAAGALPIAAWEFSLGVYLTVWGFRPAAVAALPPAQAVR